MSKIKTYSGGVILTDNDLLHWKYIKKYRLPNGKWRYVYANKDTHRDITKRVRESEKEQDNWNKKSSHVFSGDGVTMDDLIDLERANDRAYEYVSEHSKNLVSRIANLTQIGKEWFEDHLG